ncbi:MAG: hypothetical protein GDA51_13940 [Ekhidna sp.]|nr:hypothetical protein [Ekhidna sp.]
MNYKGAPFFIKTRCAHLRNKREKNRKMNPQTPPEEEFTIKILSILKSSKSCSRQPPQQPPRFPKTLEV